MGEWVTLRFSVGGVLDGGNQEHGVSEQLRGTMKNPLRKRNKNGEASVRTTVRVSLGKLL
jgi:hypothetical protein